MLPGELKEVDTNAEQFNSENARENFGPIGRRGTDTHNFANLASNQSRLKNATSLELTPGVTPEVTDHFLQTLENWNTAIPFKFHWIVNFYPPTLPGPHGIIDPQSSSAAPETLGLGKLGGIVSNVVKEYEPVGYNAEQMTTAQKNILTDFNMKKLGCIFAQGCVVPGETHSIENPSVQNSMGFLPGVISGNRSPLAQLTVQFRETNTSFTDTVIRPWVIALSHYGLVARPRGDARNIKRDIEVIQLAKVASGHPLIIRKRFLFHNCVPTTVDTNELTHDGTEMKIYTVPFHYTNYSIKYDASGVTDETVKEYFKSKLHIDTNNKTRRISYDFDGALTRSSVAREHWQGKMNSDSPDRFETNDAADRDRMKTLSTLSKASEFGAGLANPLGLGDTLRIAYKSDSRKIAGAFDIVPSPEFKRPKGPGLAQSFLSKVGRGIMQSNTVSNLLGRFNRISGMLGLTTTTRMRRSRSDYANAFNSGRFLRAPGVSGFVSSLVDSIFGNSRLFVDGFQPGGKGMSRSQIAAVHSTDDPNVFIDAGNGSGWSKNNNNLAQKLQRGTSWSNLVNNILDSAFGSNQLSIRTFNTGGRLSVSRAEIATGHVIDRVDGFRDGKLSVRRDRIAMSHILEDTIDGFFS